LAPNEAEELDTGDDFDKFWAFVCDQLDKEANNWMWKHMTIEGSELANETAAVFRRKTEESLGADGVNVYDLKERIPYYPQFLNRVDIKALEKDERERLADVHLDRALSSAEAVGQTIYRKLQEFLEFLQNLVGLKESPPCMKKVVTLTECCAQAEALIMRVAYPISAFIRWPHSDKESRDHARTFIEFVCPEVLQKRN